ncbi:MAG: hypothetical protein HN566_01970, partial [Polaribacter sp.]|nr:hypothetical protein [Polaribacter sp.]
MVDSKKKDLIEKIQSIEQLETAELKTVIDRFPYFQYARALYLKGLKNQDSFKYNNELKLTAAFTTDRTVLFDYITSKKFNTQKEDIHQQIKEIISREKPHKTSIKEITKQISKPTAKNEEKLEIGKPISFTNSENYSFNQWLQLSTKKPITRKK